MVILDNYEKVMPQGHSSPFTTSPLGQPVGSVEDRLVLVVNVQRPLQEAQNKVCLSVSS